MDDGDPQLKVMWGCTDGSISALVPIPTQPIMEMGADMTMSMSQDINMGTATGMDMDMMVDGSADMNGDPSAAANFGVNAAVSATEGENAFIPRPGADLSKRLHLLQGRLVRGVMHAAGLNPRAFRALLSPTSISSTRLSSASKQILDAALLQSFHTLPFDRQQEMCKEIGATREEVLRDLELFDTSKAW